MKNRISQIILRILLIQEEFSPEEIACALDALEKQKTAFPMLRYFSEKSSHRNIPKKKRSVTKDIQQSKVVLALKNREPEKYQILSEFDSLLRKRSVLKELNDLKKLGERLSKDFLLVKSRKEAITKLMSNLVELPINEIQRIIGETLSAAPVAKEDSEYQHLANFIITGNRVA